VASDIPNGKVDVVILNCLDVEADSGNSGDIFTKLESIEHGSLACGIKTHHENSNFFLRYQSPKDAGEVAHLDLVTSDLF
jgi:hypothetical protein